MRLLILSALVLAAPAASAAVAPGPIATLLERVLVAQAAEAEDDEDEGEEEAEAEAAPAAPESAESETAPGEEPAASPVPTSPPAAEPRSDKQKLVSGAPLFNPNVAVHIVQRKEIADAKKYEGVLYPAAVQVNGKFTQHVGTAASFGYHLHENFGLQLSGQYNWVAVESAFNQELIDKVRQQAQAATSLLMVWGVQGGVEVTPIYGKFAWFENHMFNFQLVINGGAGLASTRHQLKPANQAGPATFGETGLKFMGSLGAGFRLQFLERFAVRLEVRDLVYTARVDTVNGCDSVDLAALDRATKAGQSVTSASVAPACRVETFDGTNPETGQKRSTDVNLAYDLVRNPSSDVLNNVGLYAGFAFLF